MADTKKPPVPLSKPVHEIPREKPVHELKEEYVPKLPSKTTESRRNELLAEMNKIVNEASGFSNIPLTSKYWDLRKEYIKLLTV